MKKKILENLKSLNSRLTGNWPERMNIAHRLRSFYERMKPSLKNHESGLLDDPIFSPGTWDGVKSLSAITWVGF